MAVADFTTGSTLLNNAMKTLMAKWLATREQWDDATAKRFEEEFLKPLPQKFRFMLDSCGRLSEILQRAEQDCK
jgi:hypothetical protein